MVLVNNASSATKTTLTAATWASRRSAPPTRSGQPAELLPGHGRRPDSFPGQEPDLAGRWATPVPGTGNNLFTFMANRLNMSFTNLGCQNFGLTDPVTVTLDGNGAAIAASSTPPSIRPPRRRHCDAYRLADHRGGCHPGAHRTGHSGRARPDRSSSSPDPESLWECEARPNGCSLIASDLVR